MREIKPTLTTELATHTKGAPVWRASAFPISTYRALVEHVARLAYLNRDELLFFRGQANDYQSRAGGTTLYPSIYREDSLAARELRHRFSLLDSASRILAERFKSGRIDGYREFRQKKYIQWSILQHYQVVATPLLDLTQSLRVACSFAQFESKESDCFVYVLGMPYITNRISINSEHDIVNVRLLSICPPSALRPYFQEGFLAGTSDITTEFDTKTELDFRNRLIAKFSIPRGQKFWGSGFARIPESALFPRGDKILELCANLRDQLKDEQMPGDVGEFIKHWVNIENRLLSHARQITSRNLSVREAIKELASQGFISNQAASDLDGLRTFRNLLIHQSLQVEPGQFEQWLEQARQYDKPIV